MYEYGFNKLEVFLWKYMMFDSYVIDNRKMKTNIDFMKPYQDNSDALVTNADANKRIFFFFRYFPRREYSNVIFLPMSL